MRLKTLYTISCLLYGVVLGDGVLCGQYENATSPSQLLTFSTNAWGQDSSGNSCVNITNNSTEFSSTWSWGQNASLVHAFPNVNLNAVRQTPMILSNLSAINVDVAWSMVPSTSISTSFDTKGLGNLRTKANVAFDMFLDPSQANATSTTAPAYEVMIWLGSVGAVYPIGYDLRTASQPSMKMGNTLFTLYQGPNDNGQHVFSWLASSNTTSYTGDISPLLHYLWRHGLILASNYLGVVQFGSEALHADGNVTFGVQKVTMGVVAGTPSAAEQNRAGMRVWGWVAIGVVFWLC